MGDLVTTCPEGADCAAVTDFGTICLWIAFAGLFIPCVYMFMATLRKPADQRYFHTISFMINGLASLAYMTMASGYGSVFIKSGTTYHQFMYARYIDWALTTPLQLLDLCGLGGASFDTTVYVLCLDFLMILAGLIGALIGNGNAISWVFFAAGMGFFYPIVWVLARGLQPNGAARNIYRKVSNLTLTFWSAYPVVWVLAEGTHALSADMECLLYTVLDIVAKSVFGLMIISAHDALSEIYSGKSTAKGIPMVAV